MKKGVGAIERDREKLSGDKDRRKKDKKQRKEITSIPGSMSSEELLRLDEVIFWIFVLFCLFDIELALFVLAFEIFPHRTSTLRSRYSP